MLGFAWLTVRQAQEALKSGRLEDAHRLLSQPEAHGRKGSWDLLRQVAEGYVQRGQKHLIHNDPAAAWVDLLRAEQIGLKDDGGHELRQELTTRGIAEARALLEAGEPARALQAVGVLRERGVEQAEVQLLEEAARGWAMSQDLADRGEFSQAMQTAERVGRLWSGTLVALGRFREELGQRNKSFSGYLVELHEAVAANRWRDVLLAADQVLARAPHHNEARKARERAWKSLEPPPTTLPRNTAGVVPAGLPEAGPPQRYMLWIDGIDGCLVCLANRVTLGQAAPDGTADVPIFADVSRAHAALTRDVEGYVLEAFRPVLVNGQPVEKAPLHPGDKLTLGGGCQFQFSQPVPVSATARLDLVSGHRMPLAANKVILMADTLVLGPGSQSHVLMPDLQQPVVLYRHKDGLGVRHAGKFEIDGVPCKERGLLRPGARVTGDEFAFALEAL